jgi:hypothetical protein
VPAPSLLSPAPAHAQSADNVQKAMAPLKSKATIMKTAHESTRSHLRALVLIVTWLTTPLMGAMPGAAHAAVAGTVVGWGLNDKGQTDVPVGLRDVVAVDVGQFHTVALKSNGTVVAWGYNFQGQTDVPAGLSGVVAISAGDFHTVALKSDGTMVARGFNSNGQTDVPVRARFRAIAAGGYHTVALKPNGTVDTWGRNDFGQRNVPAGLSGVMAIAAGGHHTVALKSDGTVVAWGYNGNGQVDVPDGLRSVVALAAGTAHTVALKSDGTVVAWGSNSEGQTNVPAGLRGVRANAGGQFHTVALKRDGTVVAWGDNQYGQAIVPDGLRNIMAVSAGGWHTVALKSSYSFGGFVAPVNARPIVNTLEAGVAVPVKFGLGGNQGLDIFASGYPAASRVLCNPDARTDEIEQTVNANQSSLRYDAGTNTYTYVWKTDPAWAGQCRRLILRFADGIERIVLFRFR